MHDMKLILGLMIVAGCSVSLMGIAGAKFLRLPMPHFILDNSNEISLLTLVSFLMGLILIFL